MQAPQFSRNRKPRGRTRLLSLCAGLGLAVAGLLALAVPTSSGQILPLPPPPTASVTVCQVTGSATAPDFLAVEVSVDQLAAYLNQYPGSFVGSCPAAGAPSGNAPLNGAVTVCRVSGQASAPVLSEVLVAADQVAVYLNQNPGSFVGPCPASGAGGNAGSSTAGSGPLNAVVTVCRVTGAVNAPGLAQLSLGVDQVAAFLNQNPGSFIGTCPGQGGTVTQGPGRILGIPVGAALTICQVTGSARAIEFAQVNVAIDRVAAFLNQNPGSFVGLCPSSGDPSGTVGNEPVGYVTICRVTGDVDNALVPITIRISELQAYLTRPGTVVPAAASGCNPTPPRQETAPPSTTTPGTTTTVVVQTTPDTVVTASGAGVKESTKSNKKGKAKVQVKPKRKGVVTIRAAGGKPVKRIGVASETQSGSNLTG